MLQGLTPLHRAAQDNNMEMTKTLLAYGVDVNARTVLVGMHGVCNSVPRSRLTSLMSVQANLFPPSCCA